MRNSQRHLIEHIEASALSLTGNGQAGLRGYFPNLSQHRLLARVAHPVTLNETNQAIMVLLIFVPPTNATNPRSLGGGEPDVMRVTGH